jgi:FtsH-binding integral membrane protein
LQTYFRVGSQPACPACTEKFKQETRAKVEKYYWQALGAGVVAALVGGAVHGALLAFAHVAFGIIPAGLVIAIAVRAASRESAGTRHRITAVALTLAAGSLLWLLGSATTASSIYLAIALFAAWWMAARNVRTEISGPFQMKGNSSSS